MPVLLLMARFRVDRITNPESQNTGIETMNPVMFIARCDLFLPVNMSKESAMDLAPPVLSKKVPIMVPHAITIPMLFSVFPKPVLRLLMIVSVSRPLIEPIINDAARRVKKGCILYRAVAIMIKHMIAIR